VSEFPVGSQVTYRFYFATRPLNATEEERFIAGFGLPSGVGFDPTTVFADVQQPGETAPKTRAGAEVVKDAVGAYHTIILVAADGLYYCRGRGQNSLGEPVAATPDHAFSGTRTF
jgi:hypothetical protein